MNMLDALNSFDEKTRLETLAQLARETTFPKTIPSVNMHLHTFFSYNGEGWSPSRIAFEMKRLGVHAAAICDFDVLQGLDEFLAAADLLQLRAAVACETRVFIPEWADEEINSPGEPGVCYFMGMGFVRQPTPGIRAEEFGQLLTRSHERNRAVVGRINAVLRDFQLDYDQDVLPLTPAGNATERHICVALHRKALAVLGSPERAAQSWAAVLGLPTDTLRDTITNDNAFTDLLRSKLIKKGGPGYKQPDSNTFPTLSDVIRLINGQRAIPMAAWLDGSLPGESNPLKRLEYLKHHGIAAVNVIPDRNWNFKDPDTKAAKVRELHRYLDAAIKLDLPINVGTEANKPGQRLLDDFEAEALAPYRKVFVRGANIFVGHTRLLRFADTSYTDYNFSFNDPVYKNTLCAAIGALPAPDPETLRALQEATPSKAYHILADSARKGVWVH